MHMTNILVQGPRYEVCTTSCHHDAYSGFLPSYVVQICRNLLFRVWNSPYPPFPKRGTSMWVLLLGQYEQLCVYSHSWIYFEFVVQYFEGDLEVVKNFQIYHVALSIIMRYESHLSVLVIVGSSSCLILSSLPRTNPKSTRKYWTDSPCLVSFP